MHELSIMQALVDRLESLARDHGATRIVRFTVEIGDLSNVVPELLQSAWDAIRDISPALRATTMEIRRVPLEVECLACHHVFQPRQLRFRCPACHSVKTRTRRGEDLVLRDVELEIPDPEDHP